VTGTVLGALPGVAAGAGLGAAGVNGSTPGAVDAVVGELTTGLAGKDSGTRGAGAFGFGAVVEQLATHSRAAINAAAANSLQKSVGCIYTPTRTSITIYISILIVFERAGPVRGGGNSVEDFDTPSCTAPIEPVFCHIAWCQSLAQSALRHS
jgi:hypothetical protein